MGVSQGLGSCSRMDMNQDSNGMNKQEQGPEGKNNNTFLYTLQVEECYVLTTWVLKPLDLSTLNLQVEPTPYWTAQQHQVDLCLPATPDWHHLQWRHG